MLPSRTFIKIYYFHLKKPFLVLLNKLYFIGQFRKPTFIWNYFLWLQLFFIIYTQVNLNDTMLAVVIETTYQSKLLFHNYVIKLVISMFSQTMLLFSMAAISDLIKTNFTMLIFHLSMRLFSLFQIHTKTHLNAMK